MDATDLFGGGGSGARSQPELTALLLELGRLLKGRRYYRPGDPRLAQLFERAARAWLADLRRHGALDLELDGAGLRVPGAAEPLVLPQLADLCAALRLRGVGRLRVEPGIDAEAFAGLVEVLAADPGGLAAEGGVEAALLARVPAGIAVERLEATAGAAEEPADEEPLLFAGEADPPAREAPLEGPRAGAAAPEEAREGEAFGDPPERFVFESEPGDGARDAEGDASPFAWDAGSLHGDDEPPDPAAAATGRDEASGPAPADRTAGAPPASGAAVELEAAPLERGVRDERAAEIVDLLRELDGCEDGSSYADVARRAVHLAERASEEGRADDAYRVMLVLAEHASGRKHSPRQAEIARDFLASLASAGRLENLIDRACAPGHEAGVRASQVLLAVGEEVAPALFAAAGRERDPDRRGQMHGILIALGEKALPELLRTLDGGDPTAVRNAVRLLGDIQSPEAVRPLGALLDAPDEGLREEAAKALVRIGDDGALDVLVRALRSPTSGMPALAAYCLAASGSGRAVAPLIETLERSVQAGRTDLAREAIRALGRLGRAEAARPLAGLLLRKGLLQRRWLRDLRVAAAAALGTLPGDEAVGALAQAASSRDGQVRRAAQLALERRAQALAQRAPARR